eukprot:UN13385
MILIVFQNKSFAFLNWTFLEGCFWKLLETVSRNFRLFLDD